MARGARQTIGAREDVGRRMCPSSNAGDEIEKYYKSARRPWRVAMPIASNGSSSSGSNPVGLPSIL